MKMPKKEKEPVHRSMMVVELRKDVRRLEARINKLERKEKARRDEARALVKEPIPAPVFCEPCPTYAMCKLGRQCQTSGRLL